MPLNEADTCRKFVVPRLQAAGWDTPPHAINEQRTFVAVASPGSADRNRTFAQKALAAIEVPVPPIDRQRWKQFHNLACNQPSFRPVINPLEGV